MKNVKEFVAQQMARQRYLLGRYGDLLLPYGYQGVPTDVSEEANALINEWVGIANRLKSGYGVDTFGKPESNARRLTEKEVRRRMERDDVMIIDFEDSGASYDSCD